MISLQRVTKTYKNGVTALTDVSVEVEKGEFVFIVGQSGSGKSTMIRLLLKEEETTKGDIYVGGKNLSKMSSWDVPKLRRNVGTVFQDYKLLHGQDRVRQRRVRARGDRQAEARDRPARARDPRVRRARREAEQLPR